ncbi:hypothetical protein HDU76_007219 [Blyttiomyces sp. JEL0837]|nr:hypothetical protein HDU76_007219 [Blyttiomyces sp. JEL0837]
MNGVSHPSQPNYVAMIAGDTLGVTGDGNVNLAGNSIVDLLEAKGFTWKTYQENYPGNCALGATYGGSGAYARKHNPFISMTNIQNNPTRCANIVPDAQLDKDALGNNLPNYIFYTPNLKNDGHDTSVSYTSNWLKGFLEPKLTNPAYANTLFFVTFDESASFSPNQIYGVLLGKGIVGAGQTDSNKYDHYSWLATQESIFQLGNLGKKDASATKIPVVVGSNPCVSSSSSVVSTTSTTSSTSSVPSTSTITSTSSISSSSVSSTSSSITSVPTSTTSTSTLTSTTTTSSCAHSVCTTGVKLTSSCDPCAAAIIKADSYCGSTKWDSTCVSEVSQYCTGVTC